MERRHFLAASIATSAAALAGNGAAQAPAVGEREFYQMRRYTLMSGPQLKLTEDYLSTALISAVNRIGVGPVGTFRLDIGRDTPAYYVMIPGPSVGALEELDLSLSKDEEFLKVAAPFWNATATAPAFQRVEISMLKAFQGWPKITPASAATMPRTTDRGSARDSQQRS
jgi:hypothetical protein